VNWGHLQAFVWLRWRLMANQWRRAGAFNAALMIVVGISLVATAIPILIGSFALAVYAIPRAAPTHLMYAWDGLAFFFVLFWGIGVLIELQRNDPLSLSKFLHMPVSVEAAFLINYLSSLLRLSLITFVPAMAGYALALVYVRGVEQLLVLPSLAAFLLMITAATYQFQGWLASLVSDPRRRRTVVVGVTIVFVLVFQLPNLLNLYVPRMAHRDAERKARKSAEVAKIQEALASGEIDNQESARRQEQVADKYLTEAKQADSEDDEKLARVVRIANMVVPFGWLPLGVMSSAEGQMMPSLLGLAGMTLIGAGSLWRAYRTTLGQFLGQSSRRKVAVTQSTTATPGGKPGGALLEMRLPGLSEPVSAIALGGFRTLLRLPEAKLSLLTPLIMGGVFGSMLLNGRQGMPEQARPLLGIGAISFVLFGMLQLMSNQFGIDRDGFRVFVLCAAPRRDILLGKNLSYVPSAFVLSAIMLTAVQVLCPMRLDHVLSMGPQFISMFLVFCVLANLCSIYVPVYLAPGTLKPTNPKMVTVLLQLAMFLVLFPLCQGLTMLPLGAEALLKAYGYSGPVCLLLAVAQCVAIVLLYRVSLGCQGSLLQTREQRILETVTNRAV
jgi:ABC-2 type transport system permease protein